MINKKDFVEIEYTGKVKDPDVVFDTTDEKKAKESDLYDKNATYGPIIVCIGENQVIKGLDKSLEGKQTGKNYTVLVEPEDGFGKKDAKLIDLIATNKFIKQNIQPMPGLQVNMDGRIGTIKTVSGGRTLVDFNHPLSGKQLEYEFKINRIVDDDREKVKAIMDMSLNLKETEVEIKDKKAEIKMKIKQDLPKPVLDVIKNKITELVPSVKQVDFIKKQDEKLKEKQQEDKK
ncbi:MAG: peptidylprolyl isomerase [Candidatus Nanoarchaeia archaeon]|nr:peptidylprolyl isomerase [Candidatus Nanoarchaeia archaeon]